MQALMPRLWEEWQKHLAETADPTQLLPESWTPYSMWLAGGKAFLDFSIDWLNRNMSRDFLIITPQGEQFLLTDRIGDSELPKNFAVHAIGEPISNKPGSATMGVAITK